MTEQIRRGGLDKKFGGTKGLEEAVAGGLAPVLRYIQERNNIRAVGLRKYIPKVAEGGTKETGAFTDLSGDVAESMEVNAIAAHMLTDIWPNIASWIKAHPGKTAVAEGPLPTGLQECNEQHVLQRFVMNSEDGFRYLRHNSTDIAQFFVSQDYMSRSASGDTSLKRLQKLLKPEKYKDYKHEPETFLLAGFNTAADTVWGLFNTIPALYRRQSGQEMTPQVFREIAPSAKTLALSIAGLGLDISTLVRQQIQGEDYKRFSAVLEMQNLHLVERRGKMEVDLTPQALKAIISMYEFTARARTALHKAFGLPDEPVLKSGCPALFVPGEGGANIIDDYFNWSLSLTEKYYFPTLGQ